MNKENVGKYFAELEKKIKRLRAVGCTCTLPLFGKRPGGRIRCRLCNKEE